MELRRNGLPFRRCAFCDKIIAPFYKYVKLSPIYTFMYCYHITCFAYMSIVHSETLKELNKELDSQLKWYRDDHYPP